MLVSEWANYHAVLAVHVVVCNFVMEYWVVSGSGASLNVRLAVSGTLTDLIIHHWLLTFLWLWFQLWLWCMWVWPLLGEVFPPFLDGSVHMESWTAVLVYESLRGWWSLLVRLKQAIKCFFFFFSFLPPIQYVEGKEQQNMWRKRPWSIFHISGWKYFWPHEPLESWSAVEHCKQTI